MTAQGGGIWAAVLDDFPRLVGRPYMFRVVKDDGTVAFRTEMYSRKQIGREMSMPKASPMPGRRPTSTGRRVARSSATRAKSC
jgi:1,4-alpha-glucan branching enzyme